MVFSRLLNTRKMAMFQIFLQEHDMENSKQSPATIQLIQKSETRCQTTNKINDSFPTRETSNPDAIKFGLITSLKLLWRNLSVFDISISNNIIPIYSIQQEKQSNRKCQINEGGNLGENQNYTNFGNDSLMVSSSWQRSHAESLSWKLKISEKKKKKKKKKKRMNKRGRCDRSFDPVTDGATTAAVRWLPFIFQSSYWSKKCAVSSR